MKTHELKTDPAVYDAVAASRKTFEIRKNDRGFAEGDVLLLRRTLHTGEEMKNGLPLEYTGESLRCTVTHILQGPVYGLAEGWVILSISVWKMATDEEIRLHTALQQAYVHNQNMHCYVTKGRLNDELNAQTILLRDALKLQQTTANGSASDPSATANSASGATAGPSASSPDPAS